MEFFHFPKEKWNLNKGQLQIYPNDMNIVEHQNSKYLEL
jgi:hypothetical protein